MSSKLVRNYLPEVFALGFKQSVPRMVTVNVTDRCNQQCIYCEIGKGIPTATKDRLTMDDLFWVIDEMAVSHIRKLSLCGGEPFLFRGLTDVVAYAYKMQIRCSITTNGMTAFRLGVEELEVLRTCKTEVNVSIDSFDDPVQTFIRGESASLQNALMSIQKLQEEGIGVTVLCAISKYNYLSLYRFLTVAHAKGIRQVLFQPIIVNSNYPDRKAIDGKSGLNVEVGQIPLLMDQLERMLQFEKKNRISTNVYRIYPWIAQYLETAAGMNGKWFFEDVLHAFYCREVYAIIDIAYDGGIQPCGLRKASVSIRGDRAPGLIALWQQATATIRNDMEGRRYYPECNGCCHHFSRNMLASMMKHPLDNRRAWVKMTPLLAGRVRSKVLKRIQWS